MTHANGGLIGRATLVRPQAQNEAAQLATAECECGMTEPAFALPGESKSDARWCVDCPFKPPGAVDVTIAKCECGKEKPSLALPLEHPDAARWCPACPGKPRVALDALETCECGDWVPG